MVEILGHLCKFLENGECAAFVKYDPPGPTISKRESEYNKKMMNQISAERWDEEADVVVIGAGFAGMAAAIEAGNAGASVVILEKMNGWGGNSIISDGMMAAAGTRAQKEAGIEDSPERMQEDLLRAGNYLNHPDLVRTLTERSNETFQWTIDHLGVKYKDRVDQMGGHSVPRSYTTYNHSGSAILKKMLARLKELGVEIQKRSYLREFLKDERGRVHGVVVRDGHAWPRPDSGTVKRIRARRAAVLASGGFANDIGFRSIQDPRLTEAVDSTNKPSTTGEALRAALNIGAAPVQLSRIQLGPWTSPDEVMCGVGPDFSTYITFPYGVMIHPATGKRFVNEMTDRKERSDAILRIGRPCIGIADAECVALSGRPIDHCLKKGVVKEFAGLEELARAYGLPVDALAETVTRFNGFVERSRDEEFGKPILSGAGPLIHPPFYGIRLWPKIHHTMGGVHIDVNARVMGLDRKPIPGLYAAGEVTGGVHGACRMGSCAITDCLVFGRIAGRNAALGTLIR